MFRKSLFIFFVLIPGVAFAQFIPPTGLKDEGGTEAKPVFTIDCVGNGISCSHSGTTGTVTVDIETFPPGCVSTDDFCFLYEDGAVKLYVASTLQAQWPSIVTYDYLLLESGEYFLLEDGSKLILE